MSLVDSPMWLSKEASSYARFLGAKLQLRSRIFSILIRKVPVVAWHAQDETKKLLPMRRFDLWKSNAHKASLTMAA
jgi:hypothetical protein